MFQRIKPWSARREYDHVVKMTDDRTAKKALERNFVSTREEDPENDGVEKDVRKLGVTGWRSPAEDRLQWRQVVESVKTRLG